VDSDSSVKLTPLRAFRSKLRHDQAKRYVERARDTDVAGSELLLMFNTATVPAVNVNVDWNGDNRGTNKGR
jgi:hypothetical protein